MSQFFSRKNFWIFDLDNTLYPASTRIFNMIDQRMKSFISMKLNISPEEAFTLQKDFLVKSFRLPTIMDLYERTIINF